MAYNISINDRTSEYIKNYNFEPTKDFMKFTSIVILSFNELENTKLCIESVKKFTLKSISEIIVVDNGSTDGTVEWLRNQDDIKTIFLKINVGIAPGFNIGYKEAKGDTVVFLANDTIVTPNWINNISNALYSDESIAAVTAVVNKGLESITIPVSYNNIEEMISFAIRNNISDPSRWKNKILLGLYCIVVKKKVLDKVGAFDERFAPAYFEDFDLGLNLISNGYKIIQCDDAFIHHFSDVTIRKNPQRYEIMNKGQIKFNNKWKFDMVRFNKIREDLIGFINDDYETPINVLEIGCGIGLTLLEVKNKYKKSNLFGIEKDANAVAISKGIAEVEIEDVEFAQFNYDKEIFDYIILGSALEKIRNPVALLNKLTSYLKEDGYILFSANNIMNINSIKDIINGKFLNNSKDTLRCFSIDEIYTLIEGKFIIEELFYRYYLEEDRDKELIDVLCKYGKSDRINYSIKKYYIKAKLKK
ncbi:glycosyl transferase family protein [Clostridium bornimense]|uniref:Glycosyl transferase family protein n=1 Tax=Clostridium bornimense TaxID=1216932 RepID=W6SEY1_9CLOT|nr:glycosyltransferase [Clostridium bornimense]CDM68255.1 glycosyl transferase family protein [Clostridium bornimense]